MTHANVLATVSAVMTIVPDLGSKDVYLAYLPLAHILELAAEVCSFWKSFHEDEFFIVLLAINKEETLLLKSTSWAECHCCRWKCNRIRIPFDPHRHIKQN